MIGRVNMAEHVLSDVHQAVADGGRLSTGDWAAGAQLNAFPTCTALHIEGCISRCFSFPLQLSTTHTQPLFCRATNPPERGCGSCWAACKKLVCTSSFRNLYHHPFHQNIGRVAMVLHGIPEHDRGSVVTRRMFDCGCFSAPFYFAGLSVLTCPNFVTSGTRTAEAIDEAIVRVRRARSMTIPVNTHVDLTTLLIVADGNCLETSFTVTNVNQVSLDTNTVVSTCRWVETPIDVSAFTRELVTTGLKAMGFKTSVTTWRPVHREARERDSQDTFFHTRGQDQVQQEYRSSSSGAVRRRRWQCN